MLILLFMCIFVLLNNAYLMYGIYRIAGKADNRTIKS